MEYGMFAKELALGLDVNTNTLRRWSLELEKCDYKFDRNEQNQRIYYERDVVALREFKANMEKLQSLEKAAKVTTENTGKREKAKKMLGLVESSEEIDKADEEVAATSEIVTPKYELTEEQIQALIYKAVSEAEARFTEHVNQRFTNVIEMRDRALIQEIRETMEDKRLRIEEGEAEKVKGKEEKEEKKVGLFSFFRKRQKE